MNIVSAISTRIKSFLITYIWPRFGFGSRVSKITWEQQYSSGSWDYLANKEEADHYLSIVKFYKQYGNDGKLLDVGCGQGVLYYYLKQNSLLPDDGYLGIDISESAVKTAVERFNCVCFKQLDFDKSEFDEKFDVIVFNETLYYFTHFIKTLNKCSSQNLNQNGIFIISMFVEPKNDIIWNKIGKHFSILAEEEAKNKKRQSWRIKVVKP